MTEELPAEEGYTRRQIDALYRLAQVINSSSSPEKALYTSLKLIAETLAVERCLYFQHDAKTSMLYPVLPAFGFPEEMNERLRKIRIDLNSSPSAVVKAFSLCHPVRIASNRSSGNPNAPQRSEMAVPVLVEGHPIGVLVAFNKQGGKFTEQDEKNFEVMVTTLGNLLRNLNLVSSLENEKGRYLAVLEVGVDGYVEVDRDFRITQFSKGAENLTGWSIKEALGRTCQEVLLPHSPKNDILCARCPLKQSYNHGNPVTNVETLLHTREGDDNWVSCSYNRLTNQSGEIVGGVIAIKDIRRAKARDDELRQQIRYLESLQGIIDAISGLSNIEEIYRCALLEVANAIPYDIGTIHSIDPATGTLNLMTLHEPNAELNSLDAFLNFGRRPYRHSQDAPAPSTTRNVTNEDVYSREDFPDLPADSCNSLVNDHPAVSMSLPGKNICPVLKNVKDVQSYLCVPIKTQDHIYGVLHVASYDPYAFGGSEFNLALGISKQIAVAAERARLFQEVQQLARTDHITGLYNKREFWDRIENEIRRSERTRRPLSMMMIDLDRLKWFNDFYGHAQGDVLLSRVGALIRETCRSTDVGFRYGGDEICILLADSVAADAIVLAERIRQAAREIKFDPASDDPIIGLQSIVTMSIGIATFPSDALTSHDLFVRADAAMFRAKETGKDRVCVYDPTVDNIKRNFRHMTQNPLSFTDVRLIPPSSITDSFRLVPKPDEPNPVVSEKESTLKPQNGSVELEGMDEVSLEDVFGDNTTA